MPYAPSRSKRKNTRPQYKRRKQYNPSSKKPVSRTQIRRTLLGLAETKRFAITTSYSSLFGTGTFVGYNPLYWIQTGSTDVQRVGDEIYFQSLDLRMSFSTSRTTYAVNANAGDPLIIWLAVVKSANVVNHDGTLGPASSGFIFPDLRHGGAGSVSNPEVDTNVLTVLWQKKYVMKCNVASTVRPDDQILDINERVMINKQCKFNASAGGYLKDYNYYVVWAYTNPTSQSVLLCKYDGQVNFKDI